MILLAQHARLDARRASTERNVTQDNFFRDHLTDASGVLATDINYETPRREIDRSVVPSSLPAHFAMARARVGALLCVFLLATTRVASRGDAASDDDARVARDDDDDDDAPSPRDLRNILQTSLADEAYVVRVRRELHRAPETMWNERATSSIIKRELTTMGIAHVDVSPPGVVGVVGDGSDPVVLLRADMDALPLHEQSDIPLADRSQTPGVMHACGHDGHVAMLLGAARALARMRDERALPPGTIRFVFQPAEEGAGGAKKMLRDGLLAMTPPTSVAFALHAWPYPETPSGTIGTRPGTIMAGSAAFEITTTARTAADAVACGAAVVVETQSVVARRADPLASALVTVTAFESSGGEGEGEGEDAGSGVAVLRGQFHAMDEATFATTRAGIESGAFAFYSFKQNACHPSSLGFNIRFDRVGPFQPTDARNRPRSRRRRRRGARLRRFGELLPDRERVAVPARGVPADDKRRARRRDRERRRERDVRRGCRRSERRGGDAS